MEKPNNDKDIGSKADNDLVIKSQSALDSIKKTYNAYTDEEFILEKKQKDSFLDNQDDLYTGISSTNVNSVKDLKSDTQKALDAVKNTIGKEKIDKLLNISDDKKRKAFSVDAGGKVGKMSNEQELAFIKKIEEWEVPKDVSEANAVVVLSWLKNV
jgi:hypothetical protein